MPRQSEGYLLLEQTIDLPGFPRSKREMDTFTCPHCNRVIVKNPDRTRDRNWCAKHDRYTCDSAVCVTDCNPMEESAELAHKYGSLEIPWLMRGRNGEVLYDKAMYAPPKFSFYVPSNRRLGMSWSIVAVAREDEIKEAIEAACLTEADRIELNIAQLRLNKHTYEDLTGEIKAQMAVAQEGVRAIIESGKVGDGSKLSVRMGGLANAEFMYEDGQGGNMITITVQQV